MSAIVEVNGLGMLEITDGTLRVLAGDPRLLRLAQALADLYEPVGLVVSDHPDNKLADWLADWLEARVTQRAPWGYEPDPARLRLEVPETAKETTLKGGPGSGFRGHAGRPGKVGGSRPRTGGAGAGKAVGVRLESPAQRYQMMIRDAERKKTRFDTQKWGALAVPDRLSEFAKLSIEQRDALANASVTVPEAIASLLQGLGKRPALEGADFQEAFARRVEQADRLIHRESADQILRTLGRFDKVLGKLKIDPGVRYQIGMEAADALIAQEHEAMTRQLGDHGIHHIGANIENSLHMLESLPGSFSPRAVAAVYITQIFHDTGYLTPPARMLMDNGHPDWGAEHYDANVRKLASQVVGTTWARRITTMITDHAGTDIDWERDPVGSAVRLADNLAVYHREKLPFLFRQVSGTRSLLLNLHHKRISLEQARAGMRERVRAMGYAPPIEAALMKAVDEVNERTGAFTLGMTGGYLESVKWTGKHMRVSIRRNKKVDAMNQILDLGQKQAAKFIKSFGLDPARFLETGHEEIPNRRTGEVAVEFEMTGQKARRMRA